MKRLSIALFAMAMLGPPSTPSLAQEGAGDTLARRSSKFFFEHNFLFRLTNDANQVFNEKFLERLYATWEAGLLHGTDSSSAVGLSAFVSGFYDSSRLGVRARYRRWLTRTTALDAGAGVLLSGDNDAVTVYHYPGFSGHVTLSHGNWLGLTVQVEAIRSARRVGLETSPYKTDWRVYAGARFGGWAGVVSSAAQVAVAAMAGAFSFSGLGGGLGGFSGLGGP